MRKFSMLVAAVFCFTPLIKSQAVGIGTNNPSGNAILDINSNNKGLLLPRLPDTTAVSNPSAGLFIYNQKTSSPNFHNGARWQSILSASAEAGDSITYTVFSTSGTMVVGTYKLFSFNQSGKAPIPSGGGGSGRATLDSIVITKPFDANSISFKRMLFSGLINPSIEFNVYTPGAATPYFSIMLKSWIVIGQSVSASVKYPLGESYALIVTGSTGAIGFKDWITNVAFTFNVAANMISGSYPTP